MVVTNTVLVMYLQCMMLFGCVDLAKFFLASKNLRSKPQYARFKFCCNNIYLLSLRNSALK